MAPSLDILTPLSSNHTEISKTLEILQEGKQKIQLNNKYKNLNLVLGITGSGKSTFVQWLAGDDTKLVAEKIPGSLSEYIIKDSGRISSNSTTKYMTIFPELVVDTKSGTAYYDCPGFSDTRSVSIDIASTYFIKTVADHAKSAKLIFVVGYPSVRIGVDRRDFAQLLKHATDLIKDMNKFGKSLALVVTKVDNQIVETDAGFQRVPDKSVIATIASFLREVKQELSQDVRKGQNAKAIKFIDILLQKDGSNYPKIGIFRRPDRAGLLNDIPLLVEGKEKVVNMIDKLEFTSMKVNELGYTISDSSKSVIHGLVEQINDNVWKDLDKFAQQVRQYYQELVDEIRRKIMSFSSATENVEANKEEAQEFVTKHYAGFVTLANLMYDLTEMTTEVGLAEVLNNTIKILQIPSTKVSQTCVSNIANQAGYFEFLQRFSASQLPTKEWANLLKNVVKSMTNSKEVVQNDVNFALEKVTKGLNSTLNSLANEFWQAKLDQIKLIEIQTLPSKLFNDYKEIQKMNLELNKLNNTEQLADILSKSSVLLDVDTTKIKRMTLSIENRANYLTYLQILSESRPSIWSSDWILPFKQTANLIFDSAKWYRFLNGLYLELGEYGFQKDPSRFNVAKLENWGMGQTAQQGIQINDQNFKEFFNKLNQYKLPEYGTIQDLPSISELQLNELNQVLSLTLKNNDKLYRQCPEPGKLLVTGDYVKLSSLIDSNKKLQNFCSGNFKISSMNVFATNTIFIDSDLDATGDKLKLTFIAPKWEIIGKDVNIILDGSSAGTLNQTKATNANCDRKFKGQIDGHSGKPGLPGGSAGSFFGIGQKFVNGNALEITAIGGAGGSGQDGSDGCPGEDGISQFPTKNCEITTEHQLIKKEERPTPSFPKMFYHYRIKGTKSGSGGKGGDGGAGGTGGRAGSIKLFNVESINSVVSIKSSFKSGNNGKVGQGGTGKEGGKDGDNVIALCSSIPFTSMKKFDTFELEKVYSSGVSGKNGTDGGNWKSILEPESAAIINHPSNRVNSYKMFARENTINDANDRFRRYSIAQFVDQLYVDSQVKGSYDTLGFTDELQGLEEQFRTLKINKPDQIHLYQSLLDRIDEYARAPKPNELSAQYRKMFNYLYVATLGKLYNLKAGSETNMIIDVEGYLNLARENIANLSKLRSKHSEHEIVQKHKDKYHENIELQIREAKQFIETQVNSEFERISIKIDEQLDLLVTEVEKLLESAEENKEKLIEKKVQLQHQLELKEIFSAINIVSKVATFCGPYGMPIGTAVVGANSIAKYFVLNVEEEDNLKPFQLLSNVKDNISSLLDKLKSLSGKQVENIKEKLDAIDKVIRPVPELAGLARKLEEIKRNLPSIGQSRIDEISLAEANKQIKKRLTEKEKELKDKEEQTGKFAFRATRAVNAAKKISNLTSTGLDIYYKYCSSEKKIDITDEALQDAENIIQNIELQSESIYSTIWPSIEKMQIDLKEVQSKLGTKSRVALDIKNWKMQDMLKDVKIQMSLLTKEVKIEPDLMRSVEKLDESMNILIKIYDRIQSFQQQQTLTNFIANINSSVSNSLRIDDPKLSDVANKLDIMIRSNVVLQQYDSTVVALKQLVFPYAHNYLGTYPQSSSLLALTTNSSDISELINHATQEIEKAKSKVVEKRTSIWKYNDKYSYSGNFDGNHTCTKPFYVWTYDNHKREIDQLLSGKPVVLKADVRNSDPLKDSVKFNLVEFNLKSQNTTIQREIDQILNNFMISATHLGNSYYRFGTKYYVIPSEPQAIEYTFERDAKHRPILRNHVYDRIVTGDLMLSPYAMWQVKLNTKNRTHFDQLQVFRDQIYIDLTGKGSFVANRQSDDDDLHVEHYYHEYDNSANQNLEYQKLDIGTQNSAKQLSFCSKTFTQKIEPKSNDTLVKRSSNTNNTVSDNENFRKLLEHKFPNSSNISLISHSNTTRNTNSNNNNNANNTNLKLNSTQFNVNETLVMGQLIVGLITGENNKTLDGIRNNNSYKSPEQTRNTEIDRLAQKVVPNLQKQSNILVLDVDNPNTKWYKDLMMAQTNDTNAQL